MDKRLNEQTVNQLLVKSNGQDNYSNSNSNRHDDWYYGVCGVCCAVCCVWYDCDCRWRWLQREKRGLGSSETITSTGIGLGDWDWCDQWDGQDRLRLGHDDDLSRAAHWENYYEMIRAAKTESNQPKTMILPTPSGDRDGNGCALLRSYRIGSIGSRLDYNNYNRLRAIHQITATTTVGHALHRCAFRCKCLDTFERGY